MRFNTRDVLEQATKGSSAYSTFSYFSGQQWIICWKMCFSQIKVAGLDTIMLDKIERICDMMEMQLEDLMMCSCFISVNL